MKKKIHFIILHLEIGGTVVGLIKFLLQLD